MKNTFKKSKLIIPIFVALFFLVSPVFAAAPDGLGPWADTVISFSQGLMKNGLAVPAARSDSTAALGVAENDTVDAHFFSLGFGGNIVLGFDNGISNGAVIIEATNEPGYPNETAKVEMSEDGINWVMAGNVAQDGTVNQPDSVQCAKFVRLTDTSNPAIMPDDIADGYDVDGVQAIGDLCTPATTPTPTNTITPTPPSNEPTPTDAPSNTTSTTTTTTTVPGFPNTGNPTCTSSGITTIPTILSATRVSPTSISVSWGPDAGLNNFVIQYGFQDGNFQFNTTVSGFSTTINDLPANQSIWIEVAATDGCATGSSSTAVRVGGTSTTGVPGFPNTGNPLIPGLPNAGIGPDQTNNPLILIVEVLLAISIIYSTLQVYKYLFR